MERRTASQQTARVKVLLADTNRWALAPRLALSLAEAGCEVSAICPVRGHALRKMQAVRRVFPYSSWRPVQALAHAIRGSNPDIVIPSCDRSVGYLHELHARAKKWGPAGRSIVELIERSLGPAASFPTVASRLTVLAVAQEEGLSVPHSVALNSLDDLDTLALRQPFPWVIKADGTWGGGGVRIADSLESARQAFVQLSGFFRFKRAVKRLLVNRDPFWLHAWWTGSHPAISVQSFIQGHPGNCAFVCWHGDVLAMIEVEVVCSDGATGPASVVHIVANRQMAAAAGRLASRLRLSGFFGLDFMIEENTETAYLVEMNPRPAPPCFLNFGEGRDLAGALTAQLSGQRLREAKPVTRKSVVVYFPESVRKDRQFPAEWFLDVPTGEEKLISELLNPFPDRTLLFRLMQWWARFRDANHAAPSQREAMHSVQPTPERATTQGEK